jgi:hypothetical protein
MPTPCAPLYSNYAVEVTLKFYFTYKLVLPREKILCQLIIHRLRPLVPIDHQTSTLPLPLTPPSTEKQMSTPNTTYKLFYSSIDEQTGKMWCPVRITTTSSSLPFRTLDLL